MDAKAYYSHSISIEANPKDVWNALTNPEITKLYMFGCEAISDWEEGSVLSWRGAQDGIEYVVGKVVRYEPYTRLSYSVFDPNGIYADEAYNYLDTSFTLNGVNDQTVLQIQQGDFSKAEEGVKRYTDAAGSWPIALEGLKKIVES